MEGEVINPKAVHETHIRRDIKYDNHAVHIHKKHSMPTHGKSMVDI